MRVAPAREVDDCAGLSPVGRVFHRLDNVLPRMPFNQTYYRCAIQKLSKVANPTSLVVFMSWSPSAFSFSPTWPELLAAHVPGAPPQKAQPLPLAPSFGHPFVLVLQLPDFSA